MNWTIVLVIAVVVACLAYGLGRRHENKTIDVRTNAATINGYRSGERVGWRDGYSCGWRDRAKAYPALPAPWPAPAQRQAQSTYYSQLARQASATALADTQVMPALVDAVNCKHNRIDVIADGAYQCVTCGTWVEADRVAPALAALRALRDVDQVDPRPAGDVDQLVDQDVEPAAGDDVDQDVDQPAPRNKGAHWGDVV